MHIGFFACVQYFNLRVTYLTPRLNYHNFLKFNMATAILDFQNLISEQRVPLGYQFSITVRNLAQKCWSTPKLWQKSKSKMAAVRHLGFLKIRLLNIGTPWTADFHLVTKFGAKMLIDTEIIAQHRNPRWRPSAILDLSHHHTGPPTKSIHWTTSPFQILC